MFMIKKNISIRLHMIITLTMLLAPSIAKAQFIKEWPYLDYFSLIRKVDATSYMVYSDNGNKTFYLESSGILSMFKYITDDDIIINDFEISEDTVYFCGHKKVGATRYAMLGYFPLTNFPAGEIRYNCQSSLLDFKRLDIYRVENQVHAVMTAVEDDNMNTMVDAFHVVDTTWYYYIVKGDEIKHIFDDVVVIKGYPTSYVAFSSRNIPENTLAPSLYSYVWIFNIPLVPNNSVFISPFQCLSVCATPQSPVLLENMNGWVASAYMIADDTILVNRYSPTSYDRSVRIRTRPATTLKDLRYNDNLGMPIDVLSTHPTATSVNSYIYHVYEYYFDTNQAMYAHLYEDENLNSLAVSSDVNYSFWASGHNEASQNLHSYKYFHNLYTCSERKNASPFKNKYHSNNIMWRLYFRAEVGKFIPLKHSFGGISVETICGQ